MIPLVKFVKTFTNSEELVTIGNFTLRNHNPQYLKLLKEIKNSKIIDNVAIVD